MRRMVESRRAIQVSTVGTLGLALSLCISCVRAEPSAPTDAVAPANSKQELPFHPAGEPLSPQNDRPSTPSAQLTATGLPFRGPAHPRVVPAGTLLTVQLGEPISSARVHAGDEFRATLAAPLLIDGEKLLARGTAVTGRVESAASQADHRSPAGPGYFRLTLSGITVEGRTIPLQTSNLFVRAGTQQPRLVQTSRPTASSSNDFRTPKGHPLTFRLTTGVALDDPDSTGSRPTPTRAAE